MTTEKNLEVEIISPQNTLFSGSAEGVFVPGSKGPFEVLVNHAPIVSSLDAGVVRIKAPGSDERVFAVGSGFVEVRNNRVSILVADALERERINTENVRKALENLTVKLDNARTVEESASLNKQIDFLRWQLKVADRDK